MNPVFVLIIGFGIKFVLGDFHRVNPEWTWSCVPDTFDGPSCVRKPFDNSTGNEVARLSTGSCFLTCGQHGALWPYPTGKVKLGSSLSSFHPSKFVLGNILAPTQETWRLLNVAWKLCEGYVTSIYIKGQNEYDLEEDILKSSTQIEVNLKIKNEDSKYRIGLDESYSLRVFTEESRVIVDIHGKTFYGVRHGLETLVQLIAYNQFNELLQMTNNVHIMDRPFFSYRGLLIDTGRNFIPISALKRMIDGMAMNKLNILHWHLTDSNSFPFESKRVPQMTAYGTFTPKKVYKVQQIIELIEYANVRGVKIIPELDAPSHAGNGWQWGPLEGFGELALCVNAEPYRDYCIQPPCGQLNPLNSNTYDILGGLYADMLDIFDRDIFHMGGDEISFKCWLKDKNIRNWMESQNTTDLMSLWGIFQQTALAKLKVANKGQPITPIVWTSEMTVRGRKYLDARDYIIQIWSESSDHGNVTRDILNESYQLIFTNKDYVYLDHGYGPWRDNGFPPQDFAKMKYWQNLYAYDIMALVEKEVGKMQALELYNEGKIMGGEAALWSEKTDEFNMDMKLWPRSAAFAERVWSNPPFATSGSKLPRFAYPRLINHRLRMITRGIRPDTLLPESCHYINGFCD